MWKFGQFSNLNTIEVELYTYEVGGKTIKKKKKKKKKMMMMMVSTILIKKKSVGTIYIYLNR